MAKRLRYLPPAAAYPAAVLQVFWQVSAAAPLNLSPMLALLHPAQSAAHAAAVSSMILKTIAADLAAAGAVCLAAAVKAEAEAAADADAGEAKTGWAPSQRYPSIELQALPIMLSNAAVERLCIQKTYEYLIPHDKSCKGHKTISKAGRIGPPLILSFIIY